MWARVGVCVRVCVCVGVGVGVGGGVGVGVGVCVCGEACVGVARRVWVWRGAAPAHATPQRPYPRSRLQSLRCTLPQATVATGHCPIERMLP